MKKIIIVPNTLKQKSVEYAKKAKEFLEKKGACVFICADNEEIPQNVDLAIVLGGDGTMLRTAKRLYGKNIPLFGINFGRLGYLSAIDEKCADEGIERILSGNYTVEERIMLEGKIVRDDKDELDFVGLNEVCLSRSTLMHAFGAELIINGKNTETVVGDGVIVATPTGSTAYNLSLGGPILTPTSKNMVITPISPTYFQRFSIVIDHDDEVNIVVKYENISENGKPCIEIDGETRYNLENNDIIKIKRAPYATKIIKITDKSFYQILKEKLSVIN
jgi:NAD+ kinase